MSIHPALSAHYRQLLDLPAPWRITDVTLDVKNTRVDIRLEWPAGKRVSCPVCGKRCGMKDHREERVWRHLHTMQFETFLHCRVPRCECRVHGAKTIAIPWGEANSRWTLLFEIFALEVLRHVSNITEAAALLGISWDETQAIQQRAVKRGLQRREIAGVEHMGIDEKSFGKKVRFVTVLSDLDNARVLEVVPRKSKEAAKQAMEVIPEEERASVKAVAMDMAVAYESACTDFFPQADKVNDRFHIEKALGKSMAKVQSIERKELLRQGHMVFKHTRYLFLRRPERWSDEEKEHFRDIEREFGAMKFSESRIGRAWAIKEAFRYFWTYVRASWAKKYFDRWYFWATHSQMQPIINVARMIKKHLPTIITYFEHRITNAFAEGTNSVIQTLISNARGFRNFENYRTAILFHLGKLDMNPR
jgi:transposase